MATTPGKVTRFTEVDVVVTGLPAGLNFRIDGYDDGTSVAGTPQGDRNTVRNGNDGIDAFAESASRYWIWALSLLESSDSNDRLSAWLDSGLTANMSYIDKNGRTKWSGLCRIRQFAGVSKSGGVETSSWDIHMVGAQGKVGGLSNPS